LHGDDTTVPVLAKGKTDTGRIWVYVRDDKPFGGQAPPGAVFYYSRDRAGEHPQAHLANYSGIFQADAYGGYGRLYEPGRNAGPILQAACWVHARRPFFVMADLAENARRKAQGKKPAVISPLALETVRRIDALFEIERTINGQSAERRKAVRQELSAPLAADLQTWMRAQRAKLSRAATMSPRLWTTCSSAGARSPAFSMTAASACQTMRPSVACAASLWVGSRGCSAARIAAASGRR
jgi:hypothetical protein